MSKLVPKYTPLEAIHAALSAATKALQEVRDLARRPGPPGKDGLSLDKNFDFDVAFDGERTFALKWTRNGEMVQRSFKAPFVLDRGVWREGAAYEKGDGVSYGGSFWIAQGDTTDKPDGAVTGWRLAVKKGRDGKDGTPPKSGPAGPIKVG